MKFKVLSVLAIFVLILSSCTTNKRTNVIVPGLYYSYGIDDENDIDYYLAIEQITKSEYLNANGQNVIKDAISNNYYSVNFEKHSNDDIENVPFTNLKDAYDGAEGTPVSYVDDNGYWLTPFTSENGRTLSYLNSYYSVHIKNSTFELITYLYAINNYFFV